MSGHVEVEELPAQAVIPRGTPRLGLTGTIAVVAMAGLLAAGFGVLGGRPSASPVPSRQAGTQSAPPPPTPRVVFPGPQVTPWTDCAAPPAGPPAIELQVDGKIHGGLVEEVDPASFDMPSGPVHLPDHSGSERIEIPADLVSEVWIDGGVCAVAWSLTLVQGSEVLAVLDSQANLGRDPSVAAQNRFALQLNAYANAPYILVGRFHLGTMAIRASWPIRVPPLPIPAGLLRSDDGEVPAVMGCDVTLWLANQLTQDLQPCVDDVGDPPTETMVVEAGEPIEFVLEGNGAWQFDGASATCGRLLGPSFLGVGDCRTGVAPDPNAGGGFISPRKPGRWVLALSACAWVDASRPGRNQVCGTWYASIEVRR